LDAGNRISNTTSIWDEFCSSCTQQCSTVNFIVTPSSVSAPSVPYAYMTKSFIKSTSVPLPTDWLTNWRSEVQNNYVSIDVVCESLQVENYTQESALGVRNVLSNVGDLTGLWIGMSFLSIMEFVDDSITMYLIIFDSIIKYVTLVLPVGAESTYLFFVSLFSQKK
jgi:hypothetical protein